MTGRFPRLAALGLLLSTATIGTVHAADDAGTVLAISGAVRLEADGHQHELKAGEVVHIGDALMVGEKAKLKLRMSDGSVVSAGSGARLTVTAATVAADQSGRDVRLSLASGLLRSVVTTMTAPSRFEVDTATAVAAVRSTDWFVEVKPGVTVVGVLKGAVALSSKATGTTVEIPKDFGARVEAGQDPRTPRLWQKSEFDEYRQKTDLP